MLNTEELALPRDKYFELVNTPEDLEKLISSGMAWEWFPEIDGTWETHCLMKTEWLRRKGIDN